MSRTDILREIMALKIYVANISYPEEQKQHVLRVLTKIEKGV
jgi:hypothetical protein